MLSSTPLMNGLCAFIVPLPAVAMNYDDIDEKTLQKTPLFPLLRGLCRSLYFLVEAKSSTSRKWGFLRHSPA